LVSVEGGEVGGTGRGADFSKNLPRLSL
jgi:hypothetical protein